MADKIHQSIELRTTLKPEHEEILTPKALNFIGDLQRKFGPIYRQLASEHDARRAALQNGERLNFLEQTAKIRESKWTIGPSPIPKPMQDRRVELVTSTERSALKAALRSGAQVVTACMDNQHSDEWHTRMAGHINLWDALTGIVSRESMAEENEGTAKDQPTLAFQPRGWRLMEDNIHVNGQPICAPIFDFGLFFFANQDRFIGEHKGCFLHLPTVQSHQEALLWNEIFAYAQDFCVLPRGKIKVTVPIETVCAALEMHEILHALREHAVALSCGYHGYLADLEKTIVDNEKPSSVTDHNFQSEPCLQDLAQLLVKTCHQRGAYAISGPTTDENTTHVRAIKEKEAEFGFDGSQVAQPEEVLTAREVFDQHLKMVRERHDERENIVPKAHDVFAETVQGPNQLGFMREGFEASADDLLALSQS